MSHPRGRYTRGYLPHVDCPGLLQFITFGLADAAAARAAAQDGHALGDGGLGSCVLRAPELASIVQVALRHFDGERYDLGPWVIMPNHVHVVIRPFPDQPLAKILHSWKSFTSKQINARIGGSGRLWAREYFDQFLRDPGHLDAVARYIHENPVAAGLVLRARDWPFSSAADPGGAGQRPAVR